MRHSLDKDFDEREIHPKERAENEGKTSASRSNDIGL